MASPLVQALALQNSVNPVPSQVSPTNVVGAYQLASNVAEQNYAEQIARNSAFWGGLAGLGGAGLLAFGKPLGTKLFGGAATPSATTSAAGATSPLAAATGTDNGILTGGAALGVTPDAMAAQPALADAGSSLLGPLSTLPQEAASAAAVPTIAGDFGLAGAGTAGADLGGSVAADLGAGAAGDALAAGGTDLAAATAPDWLTALLALV